MDSAEEFKSKSEQIRAEMSQAEKTNLYLETIVDQNYSVIKLLQRIDERQALENHNGKKWTFFTVVIMTLAFYVEIVKIDDISILKNRAMELIYNVTDTYPVKVD